MGRLLQPLLLCLSVATDREPAPILHGRLPV